MADISEELLRLVLAALDVDVHIFANKLVTQLRATPSGERFVMWTEKNPIAFQAMLRAISVASQRLPKNNSVLIKSIRDQLSRLPAEIHRATRTTPPFMDNASDETVHLRYEEALDELSEEDVAYVAQLSTAQVREFVNAPTRLRPHLLKKWREHKSAWQIINAYYEQRADARAHLHEEGCPGGIAAWVARMEARRERARAARRNKLWRRRH